LSGASRARGGKRKCQSGSRTPSPPFLVFENFEESMRYKLGRFLQFVGLFIIMPLAIAGQVIKELTLAQMFLAAGVGVVVFYLGQMLQRSSGSGL
jgi:hypothetical protein